MNRRCLASDNYSGVHPEIIEVITTANAGHAVSYGEDPYTHALNERIVELLGDGVVVIRVSGGGDCSVVAAHRPRRTLRRPSRNRLMVTDHPHRSVLDLGRVTYGR